MSRVDTSNCKHFPGLKSLRRALGAHAGNSHFNIIVLIAIALAGSEPEPLYCEQLTISLVVKAIGLARNVNLRNTFSGRFSSLVLVFWHP